MRISAQATASMPLAKSRITGLKMVSEGKPASFRRFLGRISKAAVVGVALAANVLIPRPALAKTVALELEADYGEAVTLYEPVAIKKSITLETFGVSLGAAAAVFASGVVVGFKKENQLVEDDVEALTKDAERMEQFKVEFLDGEVSDRSLFASLNKAMKKKLPEGEKPASMASDDEFEKNVQAFLNEEKDKSDKKKPEFGVNKGGPTLLERPDDIDGAKAEEWLNDVGFEDKPAEIDEERLKSLQRMFGGDMPKF